MSGYSEGLDAFSAGAYSVSKFRCEKAWGFRRWQMLKKIHREFLRSEQSVHRRLLQHCEC